VFVSNQDQGGRHDESRNRQARRLQLRPLHLPALHLCQAPGELRTVMRLPQAVAGGHKRKRPPLLAAFFF
jgi:hypothetical protein